MANILYLLESLGTAGGNLVIAHHVNHLSRAGHSVVIVSPYGKLSATDFCSAVFNQDQDRLFRKRHLIVRKTYKWISHALPFFSRTYDDFLAPPLLRSRRIYKKLVDNSPPSDIVVATHSLTAHAAHTLKLRYNIPGYYHIQGYEPWFTNDQKLKTIIEQTYTLNLSKILNSSVLSRLIAPEDETVAATVFPGVDRALFHPPADDHRNTTETRTIRLLSYCDSRFFKGWDIACEAIGYLSDMNSSVQYEWHVFGKCDARIPKINGIPCLVHGHVDQLDLANLYRQSHIYFMSSLFESFPLQPVEAMCSATAVICTSIGTEDFAFNDVNSLVIEPSNPPLLAEKIFTLSEDSQLRRRLISQALKTVESFTWESSCIQLEQVLQKSF